MYQLVPYEMGEHVLDEFKFVVDLPKVLVSGGTMISEPAVCQSCAGDSGRASVFKHQTFEVSKKTRSGWRSQRASVSLSSTDTGEKVKYKMLSICDCEPARMKLYFRVKSNFRLKGKEENHEMELGQTRMVGSLRVDSTYEIAFEELKEPEQWEETQAVPTSAGFHGSVFMSGPSVAVDVTS
jgi:hypothetical protein